MQKFLTILALLLFLFGCAEAPKRPEAKDRPSQAALALESGEYHQAIFLYSSLADESLPPEQYEYRYLSALAMFRAGLVQQAQQTLEELPFEQLGPKLRLQRQLLQAEIALKRDPEQALNLLQQPAAREEQLPEETALFADYHQLRARTFARLGNHLETAREYIRREFFLADTAQVEANQLAIWQALSILTPQALAQIAMAPPPDLTSGWLELVAISKDYSLSPAEVTARIARWRQRYPGHPASEQVLSMLIERSRELATRPANIALLLPLSGRFAQAGQATLEGVLAAYYRDPQHNRITLRVHDIGEDPAQVTSAYSDAVLEGAEFVIGPLDKIAVSTLAQQEELPVPTLALNYATEEANANLYQFSLAPEDEAREIAERAWQEGYTQAAVLVPKSSLGERMQEAFLSRWQELGGVVVAEERYDSNANDFSEPLKSLLRINDSEIRHSRVSQLMGERTEFIPRRRQDIDFIYMAAFPRQARLIRPQLKFHHAGDVPVLATSHLYSGKVERALDRDMDGILFCDMPWTLNAPSAQEELRQQDAPLLKTHAGQLQRLVALGVDAYQLVPLLPLLEAHPYERYRGETGTLHVGKGHQIKRQLIWARFRNGVPQLERESIRDEAASWQVTP